MKRLKYILILILSITFNTAQAQKPNLKIFEFEISGFSGLFGISGSIPNGSIKPGVGYQFSVDGKYYFSSNWRIGVGVGYSSYLSNAKLDNYSLNSPAIDDLGDNFEFRVTASGINEKLKMSAIEVPVFLEYLRKMSDKLSLSGNFGLKTSFPVSANFQCTEGTIETRGYYQQYEVEFSNIPNHGFEKIDNINYKGDLTTKLAFSLFTGFGVTIPAGKMKVNAGVYGSFGLNSVLQKKNTPLISYLGSYNTITSLSEKSALVGGGIKIGVLF